MEKDSIAAGATDNLAVASAQDSHPVAQASALLARRRTRRRTSTSSSSSKSSDADGSFTSATANYQHLEDSAGSPDAGVASSSATGSTANTTGTEEPTGSDAHTLDPSRSSRSEDRSGEYACNICLETASDPVLTLCGHLYCWPCLHQWLDRSGSNPLCPVCKAATGQEKVIPIYGRGKDTTDPRLKTANIPNRPPGQRPEHPPNIGLRIPGFGAVSGDYVDRHRYFTIDGSFTWLPLGFSGVQFTFPQQTQQPQTDQQLFLSRLFFMLGIMVLSIIFLY